MHCLQRIQRIDNPDNLKALGCIVSRDQKYVYANIYGSQTGFVQGVTQYKIDVYGTLEYLRFYNTGGWDIYESQSGANVYTIDNQNDTIAILSKNTTDGTLGTPTILVPPFPPGKLIGSADGKHIYISNTSRGPAPYIARIMIYDINSIMN